MKQTLFTLLILVLLLPACSTKNAQESGKTQAYLGIKEGGEWKWVTKASGKEQWEYQGGEFKPVKQLKVDEKHTDHSFDIQMEGPAWESDKIGYRLYLDWRNAIDIFGKKTDKMVLNRVGLDGFDSYHEMQDWGVDVLNVGSSLGMASLGFWNGEKAVRVEKTDSIFCSVENGKNNSTVNVDYYGWAINNTKTNVFTTLEIEGGSYLTKYSIQLSNELPNLATGIVVLPNAEKVHFDNLKTGWGCLATFGRQTLQNDLMGMCIFYKKDQLIQETTDGRSYVLVLKPENKKLTYYFGAAWQEDASGVKSDDDFKALLEKQVRFIN